MRLPGAPNAASHARMALDRLAPDLDPREFETLRLLVTELVTNSVRHAQTETVAVNAVVTGAGVWLEVADDGPGFDPLEERGRAEESLEAGWGLMLVDRLADHWGVGNDQDATRVWFELLRA